MQWLFFLNIQQKTKWISSSFVQNSNIPVFPFIMKRTGNFFIPLKYQIDSIFYQKSRSKIEDLLLPNVTPDKNNRHDTYITHNNIVKLISYSFGPLRI